MKKKILSVLLAVLMLTAMLTTSLVAFAASATYNVGVKTDGKTMEVIVTLPGSAKAAGGNFTLQYNKDRLTYSKTEGTVIGSFNGNYRDNAVRLSFSSPNAYTSDTQLVKIIFTVKNGKASASDISLPAYKVYDENSTNIGDETKGSAKITFTCSHVKTADKITKNPACTTAGEKQIVCSVCDAVIKIESIPAKGHTTSEWTVVKDATCTADGEKKSVCTVCGEEYTEAIPALVHKFGEWKVVKEATETAEGTKERVCSVCGEKETNTIPALTPKSENLKDPIIANTTANPVLYAVLSALGVVMLFAIVAVSVYKFRKKQLIED